MEVADKVSEYVILDINPEPWAVGTTFTRRTAGKVVSGMAPNQKVKDYKSAVQEALKPQIQTPVFSADAEWEVELLFWRQIERWTVDGKVKTGNYADATNLQKSTEDALQGLLFGNDRSVKRISSHVVAQGLDVEPMIYIRVQRYSQTNFLHQIAHAERAGRNQLAERALAKKSTNDWGPQK